MPIRMVIEKRHHLGESDAMYPAVFCDACAERITDATKAGYYWATDYKLDREAFYEQKPVVYFLHHDCCNKLYGHNQRERLAIDTPFGLFHAKNCADSWGMLQLFPLYLGTKMGMHIAAENTEQVLEVFTRKRKPTRREYPKDGKGWIYFITDTGSIRRKVKVGYTLDVCARFRELQTSSPSLLSIYGAVRGDLYSERLAHECLANYRSHNEWFHLTPSQPCLDGWLTIGSVYPVTPEQICTGGF